MGKRLRAAQDILQSDAISRSSFDSLRTLLSGMNAKTDRLLAQASKALKHVEQMQAGDIVELSIEGMPEHTSEEKKRKKFLLLFLKFWNDLKSEVARVEKEFAKSEAQAPQWGDAWGNILKAAKGPLGVITVIAVGVVLLRANEVSVVIKNHGCEPMEPMTSAAVRVPGLMIPSETIMDGGQAVAKLPPLAVSVDATSPSRVRLGMYGMTYDFELKTGGIRLDFDGQQLNGKTMNIKLGLAKEHVLDITCR